MMPFRYEAPETLEKAFALLTESPGGAVPLAGGTDLLVQVRRMHAPPAAIVDLKQLPDLKSIESGEVGIRFGATVTCSQLRHDPAIGRGYPAVADAVALIGGTAIQNRATLGGNLCNASPSADSIPALIVHRAVCTVIGPEGLREVPVGEFCTGPGATVLQPGEVLIAFTLPPSGNREASAYHRFTPRGEMDIAVAGVAAWLVLDDDGRIADARIALAAVAPTPLEVVGAADLLKGEHPDAEAFAAAARSAGDASRPIDDHRGSAAQRRHLVGVLTRRALETALTRVPNVNENPS